MRASAKRRTTMTIAAPMRLREMLLRVAPFTSEADNRDRFGVRQ
jgi:hypothetical protein